MFAGSLGGGAFIPAEVGGDLREDSHDEVVVLDGDACHDGAAHALHFLCGSCVGVDAGCGEEVAAAAVVEPAGFHEVVDVDADGGGGASDEGEELHFEVGFAEWFLVNDAQDLPVRPREEVGGEDVFEANLEEPVDEFHPVPQGVWISCWLLSHGDYGTRKVVVDERTYSPVRQGYFVAQDDSYAAWSFSR